jgi:hypothetical protein
MMQPAMDAASFDTIPFAVLVDEAWRATRRHAKSILGPAALALLPGALGLQIVIAFANISLVGMNPVANGFGAFCGTFALAMAAAFVFALWFAVVFGTMTITVVRVCTGEEARFWPTMRFYLRWRVWGTDLLARVLIGLGTLACLLPGLLLASAWAARLPVMALEGRVGMAALSRSWEVLGYHRSRDWTRHPLLKVVLLFVLGAVLGYAISFVIQAPALIVNQVLMFRAMTRGGGVDPQALVRSTLWLSIPTGVLAALAQLAVQLYVDFAITFLFLDQRRRKEGGDLHAALDVLAGAAPAAGAPESA